MIKPKKLIIMNIIVVILSNSLLVVELLAKMRQFSSILNIQMLKMEHTLAK